MCTALINLNKPNNKGLLNQMEKTRRNTDYWKINYFFPSCLVFFLLFGVCLY